MIRRDETEKAPADKGKGFSKAAQRQTQWLYIVSHFSVIERFGTRPVNNRVDKAHTLLIMCRAPMNIECGIIAEDFIDGKFMRIFRVPQDIKPQIAFFLARSFVIDPEGLDEFINLAFFNIDMNHLYEHGFSCGYENL